VDRASSRRCNFFCLSALTLRACHSDRDQRRTRSTQFARSYARRPLNSWFAFLPCARATSATLAHGLNVNCTLASFSEAVRQRRARRPELTNPSAMSRSLRSTHCAARRVRPSSQPAVESDETDRKQPVVRAYRGKRCFPNVSGPWHRRD
jgi:hypothetical protein